MRENMIDKNTIQVGDVVGYAYPVSIGWKHFRYQRIVPKKVIRITPKRTKFVLDGGIECDKWTAFYKITEETEYMTNVAENALYIRDCLYEIDTLRKDGKLFSMEDRKIIAIAAHLHSVMAELKTDTEKEG